MAGRAPGRQRTPPFLRKTASATQRMSAALNKGFFRLAAAALLPFGHLRPPVAGRGTPGRPWTGISAVARGAGPGRPRVQSTIRVSGRHRGLVVASNLSRASLAPLKALAFGTGVTATGCAG